jgi:hypothetical protein
MQARPDHAAAPGGQNAVGVETSREALQNGVRRWVERLSLRETEGSMRRLGAWVSSEEEPKPKRGSREQFILFLGGLEREDPVA